MLVSPSITIAGHVPLLVNTLLPVLPHARSGRLKVLGVTSAKRTAILPEIPTIAEAGVPGYEASIWWGMLGPAGISRDIAERLDGAISVVLREPETHKWFVSQAADPTPSSTDEFLKLIAGDISKLARVAKEAGLAKQ